MKRNATLWFIAVVLLGLLVPILSAEQPKASGTYTVGVGDSLWKLKGPQWQMLLEHNPQLNTVERVRKVSDNLVIVKIFPGEVLNINAELGAAIIDQKLAERRPSEPADSGAIKASEAKEVVESQSHSRDWIVPWLILFVLAALWVAFYLYKERNRKAQQRKERELQEELQKDPVTSGPAYIPGGLEPTATVFVEDFFDYLAGERFMQRYGVYGFENQPRPTRISPIEHGMVEGEGMVGYLGQDFKPRRFDPPIPAYRATFRFHDGTEEEFVTLQGCMNPVVYGGEVFRGFTFTPDAPVQPQPEPEPEVETCGRGRFTFGGSEYEVDSCAVIVIDNMAVSILTPHLESMTVVRPESLEDRNERELIKILEKSGFTPAEALDAAKLEREMAFVVVAC